LFTWLAFRGLDVDNLREQLGNLRMLPILLCLATQFLCQLWRFLRWGLMLRSLGDISWGRVFVIGAVGTSAVTLLPARIGELVRPVFVAEETDIDFGRASATVVAERLVDGLLMSLVLFSGLALLRNKGASQDLLTSGIVFAAIFVLAGIGLWLAFQHQDFVLRSLGRLTGISPVLSRTASRIFQGFFGALEPIFSQRVLLPYLLISVGLWITEAVSIYSLFGVMSQPPAFSASIIVLVAIVVGTVIPSGPAHLGVFEYAVVVSLEFYNLPTATSAYFGALLHFLQVVVLLVLALLGLWLGNIRFERLVNLSRRTA
jgi:uncharacterized protein (TIRG00374 family)